MTCLLATLKDLLTLVQGARGVCVRVYLYCPVSTVQFSILYCALYTVQYYILYCTLLDTVQYYILYCTLYSPVLHPVLSTTAPVWQQRQ